MTASVRLRQWREKRGITQHAAAIVLGIAQSTLCDLENGKKQPGLALAFLIERKTKRDITARDWIRKARGTSEPGSELRRNPTSLER